MSSSTTPPIEPIRTMKPAIRLMPMASNDSMNSQLTHDPGYRVGAPSALATPALSPRLLKKPAMGPSGLVPKVKKPKVGLPSPVANIQPWLSGVVNCHPKFLSRKAQRNTKPIEIRAAAAQYLVEA